jgi:succinate dehydrogenase / fumarate reductase cytochrome b subunit
MSTQSKPIPRAFIWKRVHSLMGFAIVVYLMEHLTTNAQAALWIGQDGAQFIKMVNFIHSLPFLKVLEILLIAIPIGFHAIIGIKYALNGRNNNKRTDGKSPSLKQYERNKAYNWQRISSWILLIGIILHVIQMRFIDYPKAVEQGSEHLYLTKISMDSGLYTLAPRLGVKLYDQNQIQCFSQSVLEVSAPSQTYANSAENVDFNETLARNKSSQQSSYYKGVMAKALTSFQIGPKEVVAISPNSGTAFLLNVRNTFKSFWMIGFYSLFVLAAAFHGFNGLWTFLISWGAILSYRSQKKMLNLCYGLMLLMAFFGLSAVWGTYWVNLRY